MHTCMRVVEGSTVMQHLHYMTQAGVLIAIFLCMVFMSAESAQAAVTTELCDRACHLRPLLNNDAGAR